jgi:hypothetical protein
MSRQDDAVEHDEGDHHGRHRAGIGIQRPREARMPSRTANHASSSTGGSRKSSLANADPA